MNNPDIDDENDFPPSINPFVPQAQQTQIQQQAQNLLRVQKNVNGMNNVDFTQSSKGAGIRRHRSTMRQKSKKYRKHRKPRKSRRTRKY
jgi:hypothetical protein